MICIRDPSTHKFEAGNKFEGISDYIDRKVGEKIAIVTRTRFLSYNFSLMNARKKHSRTQQRSSGDLADGGKKKFAVTRRRIFNRHYVEI